MPRHTFSPGKIESNLDIITIQLSLEEKMIGGGDVCVWVSRYGVILYARQSERDTPTTFREKTDRTEKEGEEGDKILRGVADAASPTLQMFR